MSKFMTTSEWYKELKEVLVDFKAKYPAFAGIAGGQFSIISEEVEVGIRITESQADMQKDEKGRNKDEQIAAVQIKFSGGDCLPNIEEGDHAEASKELVRIYMNHLASYSVKVHPHFSGPLKMAAKAATGKDLNGVSDTTIVKAETLKKRLNATENLEPEENTALQRKIVELEKQRRRYLSQLGTLEMKPKSTGNWLQKLLKIEVKHEKMAAEISQTRLKINDLKKNIQELRDKLNEAQSKNFRGLLAKKLVDLETEKREKIGFAKEIVKNYEYIREKWRADDEEKVESVRYRSPADIFKQHATEMKALDERITATKVQSLSASLNLKDMLSDSAEKSRVGSEAKAKLTELIQQLPASESIYGLSLKEFIIDQLPKFKQLDKASQESLQALLDKVLALESVKSLRDPDLIAELLINKLNASFYENKYLTFFRGRVCINITEKALLESIPGVLPRAALSKGEPVLLPSTISDIPTHILRVGV